MEVKNKLREIRMREYLMNPKEFAEMLGINRKTYYGWELGTHASVFLLACF
jgi:DNA-binding XRE family transcriptional regulator